jgi:diguanylate cyclase (GGDEF)-like protein
MRGDAMRTSNGSFDAGRSDEADFLNGVPGVNRHADVHRMNVSRENSGNTSHRIGINGTGAGTSPAEAAAQGAAGAPAAGDRESRLDAIKARLRELVGEGTSPAQGGNDGSASLRHGVLECVAALDQLPPPPHDSDRCRQLESEVSQARTALAQTQAELAGTQEGERQARHLALHDTLTSLPNARFFQERLDRALALVDSDRAALAVLYLDLDDFKSINDIYGHDVGDEMLRIVAARLSRALRAEDMVSRLGGDEFGCLLADPPSPTQLGMLADKLFDTVSAPLRIGPCRLNVHPSIGIALYPADGTTTPVLLKNADAAMYQAKRHHTHYAFGKGAQQRLSEAML